MDNTNQTTLPSPRTLKVFKGHEQMLLSGRKTQSRAVMVPQPYLDAYWGDTMWVKKGHHFLFDSLYTVPRDGSAVCPFGMEELLQQSPFGVLGGHLIHKPTGCLLKITYLGVERLQDISGADIFAEGIDNGKSNPTMGKRWENMQRMVYEEHWNNLHAGKPGVQWADNPFVWVVKYERSEVLP